MWTENQVESMFQDIKLLKLKFICFAQIVFKLLSGPKFDWIWTVCLTSEILAETWYYDNQFFLILKFTGFLPKLLNSRFSGKVATLSVKTDIQVR